MHPAADALMDAPVWIDAVLAALLFCAAIVQYVWLAFHGHSPGRWAQAIGLTGLAARLAWSLAQGQDPHIAAVSIPFIALFAGGAAYTAFKQMQALQLDLRCLRDPGQHCYRADRVRAALRERRTTGK